MTDKALFNMSDIKVIRKNDANLEIELIGFAFGVKFKYPNAKAMNAEFSRFEKQWNAMVFDKQKYDIEHKKQHAKETAEKTKVLKEQVAFMKVAKKHASA